MVVIADLDLTLRQKEQQLASDIAEKGIGTFLTA